MKRNLSLFGLDAIPEIERGAPLARLLLDAIVRAELRLETGDVLVVAQKIVSKAEGRTVSLSSVTPSTQALELAATTHKDPRLVELMLRESREVLRAKPNVMIVEHKLGFVMASAGIDQSNVPGAEDRALLLPEDPDASAQRLRTELIESAGVDCGVVINDSFGRAWRNGVAGIAIGVAGIPALVDMRGQPDREGRAMQVTQIAVADEIAAAASLVMGQAREGVPAVLVRGFPYAKREGSVRELIRPRAEDLFR
ncbi:MAG TPA: coenzyme F420-0:L-glutamate ligase [Burkholderiales bacterium]|nr:coenzyme F420-0:L-glutamate ligase [Burkholderiales bacterium]